jgi:short-subunit dehydrogenase
MNAISASGEKHGSMDHNQATGMTAEHCANALIDALKKGKKEVLIGNKEVHAVTLKRFFPRLFWRIIRKQSAT